MLGKLPGKIQGETARRKPLIPLAELLLGFLLAIVIIDYFFDEKRQFENLDLGSETTAYFAKAGQYPIHLSDAGRFEFDLLVEGWEKRGKKPVVFMLGNSQTHAINQLRPGEVTYPELLFRDMAAHAEPLTHSLPNANLQEFYLLYSFWISKLPVKKVVLPVFLDDLREDGIREVFAGVVAESSFTIGDSFGISRLINEQIDDFSPTDKGQENVEDIKALNETVQEKSEAFLNSKLHAGFSSWRNRETIRGNLFEFLYKLRNTALMINPQTKRSILPALKAKNLSALEALCRNAAVNGIKVYVYIPPVRTDVPPPYHENEYESVIGEIQHLLEKYPNARFRRLDKVVEGRYWGTKDPTAFFRDREYDFMHFQYRGHVILADSLFEFVTSSR